MSDSLDKLVRESRPDLGTREARNVDWAEVDRGLFGRIDREQRAERARLTGRGTRWAFAAGGLALAAAIALVVGTSRPTRSMDGAQVAAEDGAGTITGIEGGGQLLVDGKPVGVGAALHEGNLVEARGAQATLERVGKLTLVFERGSRATVTHVDGALVLALESGAVEAQVVPVPSGEAFAVDVGHSRVAVHGTHLRVARIADHVVVDLSEGVVSLGEAPRVGSTLGALLTAPAHAEFTANEPEATLALSHDPAAVRAPVTLGASTPARSALPSVALSPPPRVEPGEPKPAAVVAAPHEGHAANSPSRVAAAAEANPEAVIASAVRACLAERPRADNVTVVVSTTVHVGVGADGVVTSARFDPPVAPDVNACASGAIYKARFAHGGSVTIPVDLKLPSSAP
ncbi:MAG TPA: FecR domain-containing protein [Polyangiaceae bacterium]|jgi:ferric-dicitrate binding protein FerR (iron transport regulator)|nr:FecR domain-containing protein [Polyangiaceae bacterium]